MNMVRAITINTGTASQPPRAPDSTDAAIEAGVFGVPTMVVGSELFWGYDDLPYFERYLAGNDPLDVSGVPTEAPRASAQRRKKT